MGSILVTVSRDTTAPGLPGTPTLVSNTPTTITLDWTAALDNAGGSGIKGYDVERNGAVIASQAPKGYTDTLLTAATSYSYRIRAIDNVGNVGNFGSSASLSTAGLNLPPGWNAVPAPIFTQGTASSFSLVGIASDPDGDPITYSVVAGTLPSGVTINNTTKALDYNGVGAVATATGIRLRATSTGGNADSATFTVTISATSSNAALQADWTKRSTGRGVVWAHNFATSSELDAFKFPGSDPAKVFWISDGTTGGAVRCRVPAGGQCQGGWERPFSPLNSPGNGKATPDPALNGTLSRKTWVPSSTQLGLWADGYYYHPDYLSTATNPIRGDGGSGGFHADSIPGWDFYIQARVRMSAGRFLAGQPDGKLFMILTSGDGPTGGLGTQQPRTLNQELVVKSNPSAVYQMYTNFGNRTNSHLTSIQGSSGTGEFQPGADMAATCLIGSDTTTQCWNFPADEYVTLLIHVKPGHDGGGGDNPVMAGNTNNDTWVEVWVARATDREYTKIWEKRDYVWSFGTTDPWPQAFNSVAFNAFMNSGANGANAIPESGWDHDLAEVVFSREFIECPMPSNAAAMPAWTSGLSTNTWTHLGSVAPRRFIDIAPPANLQPAGYDFGSKWTAWTSAGVDPQIGELILAAGGGHTDSSGNDVLAFPLRDDVPAAKRLTNPSLGVDPNDVEFVNDAYADGKPRSQHGWNNHVWGGRKLWLAGLEGTYSNGRRQSRMWSYDRRSQGNGPFPVSSASAPWTRYANDPMPTKGGNMDTQGGPAAFDKCTWRVFKCANVGSNANGQSLWSFHVGSKTSTVYDCNLGAVGNGHASWMAIAHDKRVAVMGMLEGYLVIFNPDSPASTWAQKTPTGSGYYSSGTGAVYHVQSGKIICWDHSGNTVRALTIPSNPFAGTYSWSSVTLGGAAVTTAAPAGSFGKFNMLEDIGDSRSILVLSNAHTEGVFAAIIANTGP